MTKEVEKLMSALGISEEEALQVIADDKAIDRGEKLFELTDEQKKNAKQATNVGTKTKKPTVYKFDTSKRKRPENAGKRDIINAVQTAITENCGAENVEILNPEREMTFTVNGVKYKIVLSAPRK